ncbi:MAG TPA: zf-HC2 domain-containing protein [Candidatus Binatia bacterium]|jgi:anti-sigma factor RsiW|nr:zf-HC2 domain-containing protein [Candidatus Binatia bacterium]
MNCADARELITALVDNEVSDLEQSLIQGHLKECSRCQWAYEQERALKREIHNVGISMTAPPHLKNKILTDHGLVPKELEFSTGWRKVLFLRPFAHPAFASALLLLVVLPVIYFLMQPHSERISLAALQTQSKIMRGELSLRTAKNKKELRDWQMRAVNGEFVPMEYDLSSIQFEPIGGAVQDMDGRKIIVTVYKGPSASVTCFTLRGTDKDAPREATVFYDQGRKINFYTFSGNGYNAVLHREGEVICILMSDMPAEKLLALARGKTDQA